MSVLESASAKLDSGSDSEHDIDTKERSGQNVGYLVTIVYRHWIVEYVKFSDLISKMPFMRSIAGRIYALDSEGKTKEAGSLFMEELANIEEPGKFQSLMHALKELGYSIILNAIENGMVNTNHAEHKKLLEIFMDPLMDKIDPDIMANQLLEKGVISSNDADRIIKTERNYSTQMATFQLLDTIPRKNENWFPIFWELLYKMGHTRLCEEIDPKLYSLKTGDATKSRSDSDDLSTPFVSVHGEAQDEEIIQLNVMANQGTLISRDPDLGNYMRASVADKCNCSCAQDIDKKFEEVVVFFETKFKSLELKIDKQNTYLESLVRSLPKVDRD